ncbi:integrase core domain [Elysia marginata]|uniref:Integrase core domain n=1 Tax=Elysia marginata TaxID=1093978 RepID=A0AAV4GDP4_9GAST|nr:integrase core domain [Elysia marginata]
MDLAGPVDPVEYDGFGYALTCVDDFTGLSCIYLLKNKSHAITCFRAYLSDMAPYAQVKAIRAEFGREFESKKFNNMCLENKIANEINAPLSPHQNGSTLQNEVGGHYLK